MTYELLLCWNVSNWGSTRCRGSERHVEGVSPSGSGEWGGGVWREFEVLYSGVWGRWGCWLEPYELKKWKEQTLIWSSAEFTFWALFSSVVYKPWQWPFTFAFSALFLWNPWRRRRWNISWKCISFGNSSTSRATIVACFMKKITMWKSVTFSKTINRYW